MIIGRALRLLGLGLVAGAVLRGEARAQGGTPPDTAVRRDTVAITIPARPDRTLMDTTARRDTTVKRDSLMDPLARAPRPEALDVGGEYVWDRAAIFASGAFSLLDLLEQIPGVTGFRAGWLLPPEHASYVGATDRIRVFYDGVELDALHPRTAGLRDLSSVELWPLEEVMVERAPGELRVHARSWRARSTTPVSRTDVATGEYGTNLFRGFFERRFSRGEVVQVGIQQYGTREPTFGGDGDQLALVGRLGWAAGDWSVDGFYQRSRRLQNPLERRLEELPTMPMLQRTTQLAYLRGGFRDPEAPGLWAQAILSSQLFGESSEPAATPAEGEPVVPADTNRSRAQYVVTGGWNAGPLQVGATARLRVYEGERHLSPSLNAGYRLGWLQAQARAERLAEDSSTRVDATLRMQPLSRVSVVVAGGIAQPDGGADDRLSSASLRGEAGVRVGRTWLVGGALTRQNTVTLAPTIYDESFETVQPGTVTGLFGGVRGPVYRDLTLDVIATRWIDASGTLAYRPQQQVRAQATLDTRWLSRFPRGTFGLRASGVLDYRTDVAYPTSSGGSLTTVGATVATGLLEIRIQDATAFVQSRNLFAVDYELVPGYRMPRGLIVYGVRWQFWN